MGLTMEDYRDIGFGNPYAPPPIWPDNKAAVSIFLDICGQWRMGPGGVVALDYTTLFLHPAMTELSQQDRQDMLDSIRIMEAAALTEIHAQTKAK